MPVSDDWTAEVWARQTSGDWSCGSGHLISQRLVITSTHVIAESGKPERGAEVKVRFTRWDRLWEARWHWDASDPDVDIALIEITDDSWPQPSVPAVRWGRLTCRQVEVPCEATGYPDVLEQPDEEREQEQLSGLINPGTGVKKHQYHVQVRNAPKRSAWAGKTPWGGMSGAALFSGNLLIGVVVIDAGGFDGERLLATRIDQLFTDHAFVAAISSEDGPAAALESAELAPLFMPPARQLRAKSPAALLRAEVEAVRWFDKRDPQLEQLVNWCSADEGGFDSMLVIGAGGLGKTRLARRLSARMREKDWLTGIVLAEAGKTLPAEPLSRLRSCNLPLLLIVDYSETRPEVVRRIIESIDLDNCAAVRVLMLARSAGQWWKRLTEESTLLEDALDLAEVHPLKPLPLDLKTRQQAFEEAVADIAAQLHRVPGLPNIVWPDLCRHVEVPDLGGATYGSMMRLHLSALVGLLQAGPARRPTNGYASHEKVLMIHESRYWRRSAAAAGLDLAEQTLANAVVISTLLGAANKTQALALLGRVQGLRNANEDLLVRVHQWLCTLYPSAAEGEWGPLEPDRLGEYLVGTHLLEWPELLDEPFAVAQDEQLHQAFHVLARASADHLHVGQLLKRHVTSQLKRYGPVALRVVTETENPDFLIAALEDGVTNPDTVDIATLVELAQTFPSRAPALNLLVERLMKLAINLYQRLLAEGAGDYRPQLAQAWQQLGDHLDENQRRDEAIEARKMALRLFRELAGRERSAHAEAPDE